MREWLRRLFGLPTHYRRHGVSVEVARSIEKALRAVPEFDDHVLSMVRKSPRVVIVETGVIHGELSGAGQRLRALQDESGWRFELLDIWIA